VIRRALAVILVVLLLLRLAFLFVCHMMADRASTGRTEHPVMRHMTGNAAHNGALDAAFGLSRDCCGGGQNNGKGGCQSQ
jgi:hypothetical protein